MTPFSPSTNAAASAAERVLRDAGASAYIVGGAIRDGLLGKTTNDVDLALDGSPHELGPRIADALGGKMITNDATRDMARVIAFGDAEGDTSGDADAALIMDLTPLSDSGIEADLAGRDFTINAIAAPLNPETLSIPNAADWRLIDPLGGIADIRAKTVRAASETAFADDPVRMMRAVRVAVEAGFEVEPHTRALIRRDAALIVRSSAERVREVLLRTLDAPGAASVRLMDALGLLSALMPELDAARGVEQPKEHYYDVFGHLTAAAEFAGQIVADDYEAVCVAEMMPRPSGIDGMDGMDGISAYFSERFSDGHTRGAFLKFAALLHDVGKPQTKTVEPSGRVRFFGHSEVGEEIAADIMGRLRFGRKGARLVGAMIRHHLRPRQMADRGKMPTNRAIFRYYRDLGDAALDTLYLNMADFLAARGPMLAPEEMAAQARVIGHILAVGPQPHERTRAKRAGLLTGHDIMNEFSLEPGPMVGRLLKAVARAEADGKVDTKDEALKLARTHLESGELGG